MYLVAIASLLRAYEIDAQTVGKVLVYLQNSDIPVDASAIVHLLSQSEIEVSVSRGESSALLLDAITHVESNTWGGRNVIAVAGSSHSVVTMLIGPNAPIVMERKWSSS